MYLKIFFFSAYYVLLALASLNFPFWVFLVSCCTVAITLAVAHTAKQ